MYDYQTERPKIFTEDGQVALLKIRDTTKELLAKAGACRSQEMMKDSSGDTWLMLACIDRLVELGEIKETVQGRMGQYRIFESPFND